MIQDYKKYSSQSIEVHKLPNLHTDINEIREQSDDDSPSIHGDKTVTAKKEREDSKSKDLTSRKSISNKSNASKKTNTPKKQMNELQRK